MKGVEVTIRYSDGRTERHTFDPRRESSLEINIERYLTMPAFKGTMYGPTIEIKPLP